MHVIMFLRTLSPDLQPRKYRSIVHSMCLSSHECVTSTAYLVVGHRDLDVNRVNDHHSIFLRLVTNIFPVQGSLSNPIDRGIGGNT